MAAGKPPMDQVDILIQPIWEMSPFPTALLNFHRDPHLRRYVYVNPAFLEVTGYSKAEVIGSLPSLLYGPKTSRARIQECEKGLSNGQACMTVLIQYRKDGSEYVAHATTAPLRDPDGGARFLIMVETAKSSPFSPEDIEGNIIVPLFMPMPLMEYQEGHLPTPLKSRPELDAVKALWFQLRGDRPLPERKDFELSKVVRWASHMSLATVLPEGVFQFRLFGTELARVYGHDLTGRILNDLSPRDLWSVVVMHYKEVVRTRQPLFMPISVANGHWYSEVSRLLLPLADTGGLDSVAFVMGVDYLRST